VKKPGTSFLYFSSPDPIAPTFLILALCIYFRNLQNNIIRGFYLNNLEV